MTTSGTFDVDGQVQIGMRGSLIDQVTVDVEQSDALDFDTGATLSVPWKLICRQGDTQNAIADSGEMTISDAVLDVQLSTPATVGIPVTVIDDAGGTPVTGQFQGLNEGATIAVGDQILKISYVGGDGQDVVLRAVIPPTLTVSDAGGTFTGSAFPATYVINGMTNGSLEGVTPTLNYYMGSTASGTPLAGAPSTVGSYSVLATFPGSDSYTSASAHAMFNITQVSTTTAVVASPNPSVSDQSVTVTATVSSAAGAPPDGSVQFFVGGVDYGSPVPLSGGKAQLAITEPAGSYTIAAEYTGDANYAEPAGRGEECRAYRLGAERQHDRRRLAQPA